jgi:Tol biopolymer transport system component
MESRTPRGIVLSSMALLALVAQASEITNQSKVKDRIYVDQYGPLRSELFIADADGKNPRKLVPGTSLDYNGSFSADGQWVVFTSERTGNADLFRVHSDGTGLERLTDSPAYDDQAALSPDNNSVAFVSSRDMGSTDIYILDLKTRKVRNLTRAAGGDFRPSWSPDGQWIAFASDRGMGFPHAAGQWEHLQGLNIFIIRPDGTGLKQITSSSEVASGSPKWSPDGKRLVFYELPVKDTFAVRGGGAARVTSRIVSVDVSSGARTVHVDGGSLNLSPQYVGADRIAFLAKTGRTAALAFSDGTRGTPDDIMNPSWSADGTKVVYHAGQNATMHSYAKMPGTKVLTRDPRFELVYGSGFPAVSPDGKYVVVSERVPETSGDRASLVVWETNGANPKRIYHDEKTVMGLDWSRDGQWIAFGAGTFFGGRARNPARIMIIKPDGSGQKTLTTGLGNAGFPSWSPDGKQIVYRFWTSEGSAGGLRIVDVETGNVRTLTAAYDTLPVWSPKGDQIVFNRFAKDERFRYDEFDIWTIHPDGTGLKRLTDSEGNDAHPSWSPDGNFILWSSSRFGWKDEASLTINQPQPYAELFIMNADGSNQQPLTDNQYEDGTPAWMPPVQLKTRK